MFWLVASSVPGVKYADMTLLPGDIDSVRRPQLLGAKTVSPAHPAAVDNRLANIPGGTRKKP